MPESTARRLLVSVPTLHDPNFFRAVVFMIEHTGDGALGLVLNQPTETRVDAVLDAWAPYAAAPAVAFVGGPVQQHEAVVGLGRVAILATGDGDGNGDDDGDDGGGGGWQPLLGRVGTVDLGRAPHDARPDLEAVRIFAGYSGWGPSQLEGELAAGGWFVADAHPDDLLTSDPAGLWRAVLRRQGGDMAVAANYPLGDGPALN
jgi:putative transcriptional regulator